MYMPMLCYNAVHYKSPSRHALLPLLSGKPRAFSHPLPKQIQHPRPREPPQDPIRRRHARERQVPRRRGLPEHGVDDLARKRVRRGRAAALAHGELREDGVGVGGVEGARGELDALGLVGGDVGLDGAGGEEEDVDVEGLAFHVEGLAEGVEGGFGGGVDSAPRDGSVKQKNGEYMHDGGNARSKLTFRRRWSRH